MDFGRQRGRGQRRTEISSGGSEILPPSAAKPQVGAPPEGAERQRQRRERVYEEFFGPCEFVDHEVGLQIPHVDVYVYPPGHAGRDFYTLVTGGMSDLPMQVPRGAKARRTELVLYALEPKEAYRAILRFLAHFPHDHRTWFGQGHTFPNGQPAQPLFEGSALDTLLLLGSILQPDATLPNHLHIEKDPVHLLWVVPITTAECERKLRDGTDAILDLFEQFQHPFVLNEARQSYVGPRGGNTRLHLG